MFASLQSGNNGLNALSTGTIAALSERYDGMEFRILFPANHPPQEHMVTRSDGQEISVTEYALSFRLELEILLHLFTFGLYKPFSPYFRQSFDTWRDADILLDFSGGDSFTDLYGVSRFLKIALIKLESIMARKRLILMPQTFGPFRLGWARAVARGIVRKAEHTFLRDAQSYDTVLNGLSVRSEKCDCIMDMAFYMPPSCVEDVLRYSGALRSSSSVLIGLNVSGLLYSGGYTRDNMFGLKADYGKIIRALIEGFLNRYDDCALALIPHVIDPDMPVEDDRTVCRALAAEYAALYPGRITVADAFTRADELKRIIGSCDFFIGSRMHACIAAISMRVPTAPIAYSKKFIGIWAMMGLADCIADPRTDELDAVTAKVFEVFDRRENISPNIQKDVHKLYAVIDDSPKAASARRLDGF